MEGMKKKERGKERSKKENRKKKEKVRKKKKRNEEKRNKRKKEKKDTEGQKLSRHTFPLVLGRQDKQPTWAKAILQMWEHAFRTKLFLPSASFMLKICIRILLLIKFASSYDQIWRERTVARPPANDVRR